MRNGDSKYKFLPAYFLILSTVATSFTIIFALMKNGLLTTEMNILAKTVLAASQEEAENNGMETKKAK